MRSIQKSFILAAAVAVLAALLLAGCHQGNHKEHPLLFQKGNGEQIKVKMDSLKEDSIKAFYERMRRWDALHGGIRQRESDK